MKRSNDPLGLTPHWHVDLRIESELPDDTVIGTRFLVHVAFTAVAIVALLFVCYKGYVTFSIGREIADWEKRINDNRAEVGEIQRMQREYSTEAVKIDQAYSLIRPQLYVSEFVANVGRTRPDRMAIDIIEWNESGVVVRGNLRERSDRATELLGGYVDQLRRDEKIGPYFKEIVLTDLDRGSTGETLRFEIKFILKGGA
jgi:hypothetical protein